MSTDIMPGISNPPDFPEETNTEESSSAMSIIGIIIACIILIGWVAYFGMKKK